MHSSREEKPDQSYYFSSSMIVLGSTPTSLGQRTSPELTPPQSPRTTGVAASKLAQTTRKIRDFI